MSYVATVVEVAVDAKGNLSVVGAVMIGRGRTNNRREQAEIFTLSVLAGENRPTGSLYGAREVCRFSVPSLRPL